MTAKQAAEIIDLTQQLEAERNRRRDEGITLAKVLREERKLRIAAERQMERANPKAALKKLEAQSERDRKRSGAAIARAEARALRIKRELLVTTDLLEKTERQHDDLMFTLEDAKKEISAMKVALAEGAGKPNKQTRLLLERVKKHLSNPRTGVPFKGAEALCKQIDKAIAQS